MNLADLHMYLRYGEKTVYLQFLKHFAHLDFTGRRADVNPELRGYEGCYSVSDLLRSREIGSADSILDIGCGKGLFLYYASRFPFGKIDGIEYSGELARQAAVNMKSLSDKRIHVYHKDARQFSDYGKYNYFFVNNPFGPDVMRAVVLKIKRSHSADKKKLIVIYQFPFSQNVFLEEGFQLEYDHFPNCLLTFQG